MKRKELRGYGWTWLTAAALALAAGLPPRATAQTEETRPAAPALSVFAEDRPRSVGELVNVFGPSELRADRRAEVAVTIFGDAQIDGPVDDQCVTVFGNARVNGEIGDQCVTVFGDLDLNSEVHGQVVVVGGQARLGPKAVVHGECIVVGGKLTKDPEAQLLGQKIEVGGFLPSFGAWFTKGLFLGRPLPPGVDWVWIIVGLHFLAYLLLAALIPRPVEACERVLESQALPAFGVGLLGLVLSAPLSFVLMASGVGLVILPFLWLACLVALFTGKASMFQWIGRSICRRLNTAGTCPPLLGFLVGFALITVLYMVPLLGLVIWGLSIPLGFGAALMALIETIKANRAAKPSPAGPIPVPMAVTPPVSPVPTPPPAAITSAPGGGPLPMPAEAAPPAIASLAATTPAPDVAGPAPAPVSPPPPAGTRAAAECVALQRAGFWIRFAAMVLDLILLGWVFTAVPYPLFVFLLIAYHVALWTWRGTTIGGIVCGLKVVRVDGRDVDFTVALVRSLGAVFSVLALGFGFFWVGWTAERQSWHDKIAGTVIVKVPKGMSLI